MNLRNIIIAAAGTLAITACDLDEKFYSSVTPDTFFTQPENTYAVLSRPFTHWKWYLGNDRWYLQELTTDEMACPAQGKDFYNNGEYVRLHEFTWAPTDRFIVNTYEGTTGGIARALEAYDDLSKVDYGKLGMSEADRDDQLSQLNAIIAWFYMRGLDYFGGMPIYKSNNAPVVGRSTDKETFNHIEQLLKEAIPKLKQKKALGASEDGYISQAAAATMLAELYFNAESYIKEDHYSECAKLCQDIIAGVYGPYQLDSKWSGPFCFDNDKSPEAIWNVPSQNAKLEFNWYYRYFYHTNSPKYFNTTFPASIYNGFGLSPSREDAKTPYTDSDFKLGKPYSKFNDKDLRKQPYEYKGDGKYKGMFLVGDQINPTTGEKTLGNRSHSGKLVSFVDYVNADGKGSTMLNGEENSMIRLVKLPIPDNNDLNRLWDPDFPAIRLTEVYYMLAECKWRAGDKAAAAQLINTVRKRNFTNGVDPDPVPDNFDVYRLADEWMVEFLGEGRRRTDLIRLGLFTTENWWTHKATNDDNKKRFPIPSIDIQANPLLEQNPGYDGK